MTPEELDHPVKTDPAESLKTRTIRTKRLAGLNPEQLWVCVHETPITALIFHAKYLSKEQLEFCIERKPLTTLQRATHLLTDAQIVACTKKCRARLNVILRNKQEPSPILLAALSKVITRLCPTTQEALAMALAKTI